MMRSELLLDMNLSDKLFSHGADRRREEVLSAIGNNKIYRQFHNAVLCFTVLCLSTFSPIMGSKLGSLRAVIAGLVTEALKEAMTEALGLDGYMI
jgi:hypothetical protein